MGVKLPNIYYNGNDKLMPVDLFITFMDQVRFKDNDEDIPIILTCLSEEIRSMVMSRDPRGWCDVKKILRQECSDQNSPTILDCLHFLSSLVRRSDESMSNYFIRVKYFVDTVKAMDEGFVDTWVKILFLNGLVTPFSVNEQKVNFLLEELEQFSKDQESSADVFDNVDCRLTFENKYSNGSFMDFNGQIECHTIKGDDDEDVPLAKVLDRRSKIESTSQKSDMTDVLKKEFKKPYVKVYNTYKSISDINWENPLLYQVVQDPAKSKSQMFACAICVKGGKRDLIIGRRTFWKHIEKEHDKKICTCDLCDHTATQIENLAIHRFRFHHQETKGFPVRKCPEENCDYKFVSATDFAAHNNKIHRKEEVKGVCNICGIHLSTQSDVKYHIERVHENMRDFSCDQCGKSFKSEAGMKRHRILHDDPTFFYVVCDQCGKVCSSQSRLNFHVKKVHLKQRNHKCNICGMAFFAPQNLRNHSVSVHQLSDKFKCSRCGKCLPSSFQLKVHEDNHLRIRRYHCKLCDSWYTATHSFAMHIGMRHMGFPQIEAKKHENIKAAKSHEAYEKVAEEDAKVNDQ